jgi:Histidine kinase-, DNA gyrase B-, and HSP90-like ATPase
MAWMPIMAGRDHLAQYAKQGAVDALAELIWNGLDAEADEVDVEIESASLVAADRAMYFVTGIKVSDNGHGMTPDVARVAFRSLGDSWKRTLNGRTVNGRRALHGRLGRGRFYAYALGSRARWHSVSRVGGSDTFVSVEIDGDAKKIDGFSLGDSVPTSGPPGTTVTIVVEQGRNLAVLLRDDLHLRLAARLAPHLLANRDITVRINGRAIAAEPLIEGEPTDISLESIPDADLGDREVPVLTIVDWADEMKQAPGIVLCNEAGQSLIEIEKSAPPGTVRSTGYLRWSGFSESANELLLARMTHTTIIDEATKTLELHVRERVGTLTTTIVDRLKEDGAYPYPEQVTDPIQLTEQEMFDLVAVTARTTFSSGNQQQRAMSARLLKLALEERPEDLDEILAQTLSLSETTRVEIADMLRHSSLGKIVGAASEVTRRLDLIATLRHLIYSPDVSAELREVDQLHPLIKDHAWLFGEDWRLSRSEASLTNVLRAVVDDEVLLEADLAALGGQVLQPDGRRGRVDLLLERTILSPSDRQRLVVELKRPSVSLGNKELGQVRSYASALSNHSGVGPGKWTFWLVGAACGSDIKSQVEQRDRAWGHIEAHQEYDIWVTTWGRLLDEADRRLAFYREQLKYDISQEQAVHRVRARHAELLPAAPLGSASVV